MEYEVQVEKDQNGRVIVNFYGIDFDITDEFVDGKCRKTIFGDRYLFILEERKEEKTDKPVENAESSVEPSEETQPSNDNQQEISEETHHGESPVAETEQHEPEQPAGNTEENHTVDDSSNENTSVEEGVMESSKEAESNPETQEGEN